MMRACEEALSARTEMAVSALAATIYQRRDYISIPVYLKETLLINRCPSGFAHFMAELGIISLHLLYLGLFHRSTAISLNATYALALLIIAGKILHHDIFRDKDVAYLYDRSESGS